MFHLGQLMSCKKTQTMMINCIRKQEREIVRRRERERERDRDTGEREIETGGEMHKERERRRGEERYRNEERQKEAEMRKPIDQLILIFHRKASVSDLSATLRANRHRESLYFPFHCIGTSYHLLTGL